MDINLITNPFNGFSQLYKEGVDYVINQLPKVGVTMELVIGATSNFWMGLKANIDKGSCDYTRCYAFLSSTMDELEQVSLSEILRNSILTEKSVCFINNIMHISEKIDYITILTILNDSEKNILSSDMSPKEKQLPLLYVAAAKYSINYWLLQINNNNSPWIYYVNEENLDMAHAKWAWKEAGQGALAGMYKGLTKNVPTEFSERFAFEACLCCSIVSSIATSFFKSFK